MKRKLLILVIAALVLGVSVALQPDPSVDWRSFQARLRETLQNGGFTTTTEQSWSPKQVPLPPNVRWHPRRWFSERPRSGFGFPDGAERYLITQKGTAEIECLVRYLDGRASVIVLKYDRADKAAAKSLCAALTAQFPGLPIRD